jgi:hypothetical protein
MVKHPIPPKRIPSPNQDRRATGQRNLLRELVLLRDLPLETRMKQARAPLYLKRYE